MRKIIFILFICLFLVSCGKDKNAVDMHNFFEHEYEKVEITKEATCTEYGIRKLICSCGATIEEKTPMYPAAE